MTPPSPARAGGFTGRSLHLHLDRRRMVLLGVAGGFLIIAVVFGALAYFRATPGPSGATHISVPFTSTVTMTPSPISSPAAGETSVTVPSAAVVTVTSTRIVSVPQASAGSDLGAIESGASTLGTVVAAGCAVIALRPQGRGRPPAPAAAAADAPASTPTT